MWLQRLNNPSVLCLLISMGLGVTLQDEWNQSLEDDETVDFFDFPISKLLKQLKEIPREDEAEEIPDAIKRPTIEPEAEMLPAHYTGVKSPGVDHMELVITDAKMENSDGDVHVVAVKNKKSPQDRSNGKIQKDFKVVKEKSPRKPQGVERSKRKNLKTVRNYIHQDVFEKRGTTDEIDRDEQETKPTYEV
ncbi:uncharacterized protein [Fopius arisanus]|uniref:Uncharacterized protein n=1 Tax=Fopius arisanus TaxID=64838 RepID=A0A0C9R8D5_9HYME|nr:PREDICTED: uncharacterized protein LOC105266419 [Fopius arisanus]